MKFDKIKFFEEKIELGITTLKNLYKFKNKNINKNKRIIFIDGLPGAGKSTYLKKMNVENKILEPISIQEIEKYISNKILYGLDFQKTIIENKINLITVNIKTNKNIWVERHWLSDIALAKISLNNYEFYEYLNYIKPIINKFILECQNNNYEIKRHTISKSINECLEHIKKRGIVSEISYYNEKNLSLIEYETENLFKNYIY